MKKVILALLVSLFLVQLSQAATKDTLFTNATALPARIKVSYGMSCDSDNIAEYSFTVASKTTMNISPKSAPTTKNFSGCDMNIISISATLNSTDGNTQISRTWFADPKNGFNNSITLYAPNLPTIADKALYLK